MSEGEVQGREGQQRTTLQFARERCETMGAFLAIFAVLSLLLAVNYPFRFFPIYEGGRYAWLDDLFELGGGWAGFLILFAFGTWLGLLARRSLWRAVNSSPALELRPEGLQPHPSFRAGSLVPYREVGQPSLRDRNSSMFGLFKPVLDVKIKLGPRIARVGSNEIEGGREALQAFMEDLNARRAFEGGAAPGNGDGHW